MNTKERCAIIGGTGVYSLSGVETCEVEQNTDFGTVTLYRGQGDYEWLYFIPRHGSGHSVPPHKINYRANIAALKALGIRKVIGIFAVGSISEWIKPGELGIIDQFIDMTWGRTHTFFDGGEAGVRHTGMNEPYCRSLQQAMLRSAKSQKISVAEKGVYLCVNGPRFETPAEIKMYKMWGGDVSGMTGATEAILAGEQELHYAAITYSMNWCAGIEEELTIMSRERIEENKQQMMSIAIQALQEELDDCACIGRAI